MIDNLLKEYNHFDEMSLHQWTWCIAACHHESLSADSLKSAERSCVLFILKGDIPTSLRNSLCIVLSEVPLSIANFLLGLRQICSYIYLMCFGVLDVRCHLWWKKSCCIDRCFDKHSIDFYLFSRFKKLRWYQSVRYVTKLYTFI